MEPDRRRSQISDLYHAALNRPPADRDAFVLEACGEDEALRQEVESLLAYESASSQFLESPAAAVVAGAPGGSAMLNRQLGPYTIVAPLGAGGMGEVYRARDSKLGRDVAIKILPSHFTADPERRARFAREARTLATLNHPHIGAIYGLEEAEGVTALVLELVEGPTLADRLARGPLPIPQALSIARQIAEALDAAHEKGIVHRDLKPANIVLQGAEHLTAGNMRAKVLDFGLAKTMALDPAGAPTQGPSVDGTADGRVLGTPAYMSPEQARGLAVDRRTDIWAFGCVLFEMLSGRRPFTGATVSDTIAHILERDPDWTPLPADTPTPIRTVLERCLRKDPKKRLRDIADAVIELEERAALAPAGPSGIAPAGGASRSRERIAWTVAGVLGLALGGLTVLYLRDARPAPAESVEFAIPLPENSRYSGTSPEFALSPDGRHVAFAASSDGISKLWVRSLATLELRTLPGTEGARSPFWKPDGQTVAFFAAGQLRSILLSGGSPVVLCDAPFAGAVSSIGGTWNGTDQIVFAAPNGLLWQVNVAQGGAKARQLTTLAEGDISHRWPSFLPGGEHFLYLAQRGATDELRVGSLTGPDTVSLGSSESHAAYASGHLFFVRGGNLMAQPFDPGTRRLSGNAAPLGIQVGVDPPWQRGMFSVSDTGQLAYTATGRVPSDLTWMDAQGRILGTVGQPGVFFNLDLSPDEQRLAISQFTRQPSGRADFDIWLIELTRDGAASRLTDDPAWEFDPAWSPDGSQIAFNSNRPLPQRSVFGLFVRASNGSGQDTQLAKPDGAVTSPDWSRDGRFIVYTAGGRETGADLWTLDLTGNRTPRVFLNTRHTEGGGVFSPDGQWIAYRSNASGREEVYVRPFPKGDAVFTVSREGGGAPRWRGDGKQLYFLSLDGAMMAADVDSTKEFTAGVPRQLFSTHLQPPANARPYAVTRDGTRFLIPRIGQGSPIAVVLNWRARLSK